MHEFEHWIVEGPHDLLRGFVRGWAAGAGIEPVEMERAVRWAEGWNVDAESFRQRLAEIIRPGAVTHLLVRSDRSVALRRALASHGVALEVRSATSLSGARFDFDFEIYSPREAQDVRNLFDHPPAGVTITWKEAPTDSSDPGGHGMYAPVHTYRFHGSGTAAGGVEGILSLHLRCRQHERIQQQSVRLATD